MPSDRQERNKMKSQHHIQMSSKEISFDYVCTAELCTFFAFVLSLHLVVLGSALLCFVLMRERVFLLILSLMPCARLHTYIFIFYCFLHFVVFVLMFLTANKWPHRNALKYKQANE